MGENDVKVMTRALIFSGTIGTICCIGAAIHQQNQHTEKMAVIEKGGEIREIDGKEYYVIPVRAEK